MTDEELRLECLKLAINILGNKHYSTQPYEDCADDFFEYVKYKPKLSINLDMPMEDFWDMVFTDPDSDLSKDPHLIHKIRFRVPYVNKTVRDFISQSRQEIYALPYVGKKTLDAIDKALAKYNIKLKEYKHDN